MFKKTQPKGQDEKVSCSVMMHPNQRLESNHQEIGSDPHYRMSKNHGVLDTQLMTQ